MKHLINNQRPQSPCFGCEPPTRFLGCHSVCEKFIAFEDEKDEKYEQIKQRKMKDYAYEAYRKGKSRRR